MSYSYHPTSEDVSALDVVTVRDKTDDLVSSSDSDGDGLVEGEDYFMSDERILMRISEAIERLGSSATRFEIRLYAASSVLETLAKNQAFILKKQKTFGDETDGPALAEALRKDAMALKAQADQSIARRQAESTAIRRPPTGGSLIDLRF